MARSKLVQVNEKIAEGVMGGYKKIEEGVVGGFTNMTDRFVDQFLAREGESVVDAKKRLAEEQAAREEAAAEKARHLEQQARMEAGRNTGKQHQK